MSRRTLKLIEKKKKQKKYSRIIKVSLLILLIGLGVFVGLYFRTKDIRVSGNTTYTEAEIKKNVQDHGYIGNTLLMMLKSKIIEEEKLPFIDYMYFSFSNPNILDVKVEEFSRAGAFQKNKEYYYFNYSGMVVEKKKKLFEHVPVLVDTKIGKVKLNQPIPMSDDDRHVITIVTKNLAQKGVDASEITLDKKGNITVKVGEYMILFGDVNYIEAKIAKVPEVLEAISQEYSAGTIDMTLYQDDQEIITFRN